jgi:RNA-directed DNA polymerase
MKESYGKGVANHSDPESCVASRKATIEALTGAHAGRGIELRNNRDQSADVVQHGGRQYRRMR